MSAPAPNFARVLEAGRSAFNARVAQARSRSARFDTAALSDFLRDRAVFSIYARVSERPLFIIEKTPRLRNRQGQYAVTNQQGRILKRGHELSLVLRVLDPQLAVVG